MRFVFVLWLSLFWAATVWGQDNPSTGSGQSATKAKDIAAKGKAAFASKEYEAAIKLFKEAYSIEPKPGYLANIGQCYTSMGRYQDAIDSFQLFLQKTTLDDPLRASVEQEVAKVKKSGAEAAKTAGKTAFAKGEYEAAIKLFEEAYSFEPKPGYIANIGQCYASLGRTQEAITSYQSFLGAAPSDDPLRPAVEAQIAELTKKAPDEKITKLEPAKPEQQREPKEERAASEVPARLAPRALNPKLFYVGSAAIGAASVVSGGLAISSARAVKKLSRPASVSELDAQQLAQQKSRAKLLGPVSDVLLVAALASGGVGYLLSRKAKKPEVTVSVSPVGASLQVSY